MAGDVPSVTAVEGKVRRPSSVAFFSVASLGLYSLVWYYKVNREMRDFGARHGDRDLASTKPWCSVLAFALGAVIVAPRLVSLRRTIRRVQAVERIATGTAPSAGGVNAGVLAAALLPLGGSVHRIGQLFVLVSFGALIASITRMQARLNAAWRTSATAVDLSTRLVMPKVTITMPRVRADSVRAELMARNRRAQELLERIDETRLDRSTDRPGR